MKIGLDMLAINRFKNHGIGYYMINFCRELIENYLENDYVFVNWSNSRIVEDIWGNGFKYVELLLGEFCWENDSEVEDSLKRIVEDYDLDIYIDFTPVWGERPRLKKEWLKKAKLVGIIHDFLPYTLRDLYYYNNRNGYVNYVKSMANLYEYDKLLSNSQYTKKDAIKILELTDNRVDCIYCSRGGDNNVNNVCSSNLLEKMEIKRSYYLFPGGDAPQKNTDRLLFSYFRLITEYESAPQLVITGGFNIRKISRYKRLLKEYNATGSVVFTGFVTSSELFYLYDNCSWVLYPSLYEGFGMPIVEAWNHSKPVLTSNCTSMAEIAENCAVFVNPSDEDSIYDGLKKICCMDENEREAYIKSGEIRRKGFSWSNTVKLFFEYINNENINLYQDNNEKKEIFIEQKVKEYDLEYKCIERKTKVSELQKHISYFHLLNLWMNLLENDYKISEYLKEQKYLSIAIYGMGIVANHLIEELHDSEIKIMYAIDQEARCIRDSIPVYRIGDQLSPVDAIIVTTVSEFKEVAKQLDVNIPVISLYSIIEGAQKNVK